MNASSASQRLFTAFVDPTDMIMCCPADVTLAVINHVAKNHHLRFPLEYDPAISLTVHLAALEYTSHSARFGPFVDNILGMNWALPSGRVVRVGERVIKSTTGYDLVRFLLHSDGRYGSARDYVLRLRPRGGETAAAILTGDAVAIERTRGALLKSPWIHWLDVVDATVSADDHAALELIADCAPGESAVFQDFFKEIGHQCGAQLRPQAPAKVPALPALSLKTTISAALGLAQELVQEYGGDARVLCVNGVVHYFPPAGLRFLPEPALDELSRQCTAEGGHLSGPWAERLAPNATEAAWAKELETAWNQL